MKQTQSGSSKLKWTQFSLTMRDQCLPEALATAQDVRVGGWPDSRRCDKGAETTEA